MEWADALSRLSHNASEKGGEFPEIPEREILLPENLFLRATTSSLTSDFVKQCILACRLSDPEATKGCTLAHQTPSETDQTPRDWEIIDNLLIFRG